MSKRTRTIKSLRKRIDRALAPMVIIEREAIPVGCFQGGVHFHEGPASVSIEPPSPKALTYAIPLIDSLTQLEWLEEESSNEARPCDNL